MRIALLTSLAVALSMSLARADDIRAKTDDGREVILKEDGTWSFVKPATAPPADPTAAPSFVKDKDAKLAYEGRRKTFALHLEPGTWEKADQPANPMAEVMFIHKEGDIYAMVIAERISVPLEVLKNAALANMQAVDKDATVVAEERRTVNGADVLCITSNVTAQGIPFTFYSYYYTGNAGSIQVITWTGRNFFEESKADLEKFLNGLVILKK